MKNKIKNKIKGLLIRFIAKKAMKRILDDVILEGITDIYYRLDEEPIIVYYKATENGNVVGFHNLNQVVKFRNIHSFAKEIAKRRIRDLFPENWASLITWICEGL